MLILFSCGNREKITLEYNLKQGETLKQHAVINMDMVMKFMGQEMKISLIMEMKMAFDVKESQSDSYTLGVRYKELKTDMRMPEVGSISFDSNTDKNIATQTDFGPVFKAVIDMPFEIEMTKTGKIKSVKGLEKLNEAVRNSFDESVPENMRQQLTGQFGSQFSEEAFKSQFEQFTGYFSDKPVATGDSWNIKTTTIASNFKINTDLQSTLKSIENNEVNLSINGTVSTPEGYEQEVNGVKTKVSLKGTQKGTVKVNKNTGWLISSDITMIFSGEIEVMGTKVPVYSTTKATVTGE
jgi:hypothetical protein